MRWLFHSRRPSGHCFILTQVLLCFLGHPAGAHALLGTLAGVHLEQAPPPHCWKLQQEDTGPFMWQGRAFVPRKPSWWAEATAAAASSPPWKITQSAALPTGCMAIESVMPSSHLILCRPLLLLPPIPPSIRVFSNESTLRTFLLCFSFLFLSQLFIRPPQTAILLFSVCSVPA